MIQDEMITAEINDASTWEAPILEEIDVALLTENFITTHSDANASANS